MSKKFDPQERREQLLGDTGYEWRLQANFAAAKSCGGLASSADAFLGSVVKCILVGFDEPAERLLAMTLEWVKAAIASDERPSHYFPGASEAFRLQNLALANWIKSNEHDSESLRRYVEYEDLYINQCTRRDAIGISLTLLAYVNAGAYQRTLDIFETTSGLKAPSALVPRSEAQMAYMLSRHHLALQYSADDIAKATRSFLKRNINTWLCNGHWVRAAEWMKILFWNDSDRKQTAKDVILKCYDYLPCPRPKELESES